MGVTRRDFLKAVGVGAAGAIAFTGCIPERELRLESPVRLREDLLEGFDTWFASTCGLCGAGEGIIVRVMAGRAIKIEGNPDHPLNQGKSSVRCQAGLQALYHPDRVSGPLRRTGDRGSGQFQPITWDEALGELVTRLRQLRDGGQAGSVVLVTAPVRGQRALVFDRFARAYGAQLLGFEPLDERVVLRAAMERVFGQPRLPFFDLRRATYVLSFGADFLGTWLSPTHYGKAYGEFRQGKPAEGRPVRGRLVQIEPRMTATGASADEWLPVRPGTEGVLALGIAHVLVRDGLADPRAAQAVTGGAGAGALAAYAPERVAEITGLPGGAETVVRLAREFGQNRPALALGGGPAAAHTNGLFNLVAIYTLNHLVGNVGQPGGVILNPPPAAGEAAIPPAPFRQWQQFLERLRTGTPPVNLLLVHEANLAYGLQGLNAAEALARVPFIVSFATVLDETAMLADLVLPDHTYLEAWGYDVPDPGVGYQVVTAQQPVVVPFQDSRDVVEVLLRVARDLGGDLARALPWQSAREVVREVVAQLQRLGRGSITETDFEKFWVRFLQQGGWWDPQATVGSPAVGPAPTVAPPSLPAQPVLPAFAGDAQQYPFTLVVFPSHSLLDGRLAHLPWLQATPDPITTAVWRTWVEVNPETAQRLGLHEKDLVVVESPQGRVEVPVYIHPAIPPEVVAMPAGQGHTAYGRYAKGRGVNPLAILAPQTEQETGALAYAATRVRLIRTGKLGRLAKFEGDVPARQLEDAKVFRVTPK